MKSLFLAFALAISLGVGFARAHDTFLVKPSHAVEMIDGKTIVRAVASEGIVRMTLEVRVREGVENWKARKSVDITKAGQKVRFSLKGKHRARNLRIVGEHLEPMGMTQFAEVVSDSATGGFGRSGELGIGTGVSANGDLAGLNLINDAEAGDAREVVESDIWRVVGRRVYFFNQYRGLQIIDLDAEGGPALVGQLRLPAVGEDMYLLEGGYVALLTHGWGFYNGKSTSQLVVVDVSGNEPEEVARVDLPGNTSDSRLVGKVLYVGATSYDLSNDGNWWNDTATVITSIVLNDPKQPVKVDSKRVPGYGNVVTAEDGWFFVATNRWTSQAYENVVHAFNVSDAGGVIVSGPAVQVAGSVRDKFKLRAKNDVLTVISEFWGRWNASETAQQHTALENFALRGTGAGERIAQLKLGFNESLFATRFDGDTAYIVTFERIDPLWVVDLKDAKQPKLLGHVEVPGFSNYIHPMGDRLITLGYLNNQTALSLFDVSDPAAPKALAQVPLGLGWTEAQWDEKAIKILEKEGLILLPLSSWNGDNRVQLVDFTRDTMTVRGTIDHRMTPRRATMSGNEIVTISAQELLLVDAADRDEPKVTADVALSWSVDRVFLKGDFVIQIADGSEWSNEAGSVAVSSKFDLDQALAEVPLSGGSVVGATLKGEFLYVLQRGTGGEVFMTSLDLDSLPAVSVSGKAVVIGGSEFGALGECKAVWPTEQTLVWAGENARFWFASPLIDVGVNVRSAGAISASAASDRMSILPYWGGGGKWLLGFDVSVPGSPLFGSACEVRGNSGKFSNAWNFGEPIARLGKVYLSHQVSAWELWNGPVLLDEKIAKPDVKSRWVTRHFMQVVDCSIVTSLTVTGTVNIPGKLVGLSADATTLITSGYFRGMPVGISSANSGKVNTGPQLVLQSSGFDGATATLRDYAALGFDVAEPVEGEAGSVFVLSSQNEKTSDVSCYDTDAESLIRLRDTLEIRGGWGGLAYFGGLVVVNGYSGDVTLIDARQPDALAKLLEGQSQVGWWTDLSKSDASQTDGIFVPKGYFGIEHFVLEAE